MKLFTIEQRKNLLELELRRIVEVLKRDYEPEKVILFGSLAEGDMHEWSDIDLLIVKRTAKRPIDRILEVRNLAPFGRAQNNFTAETQRRREKPEKSPRLCVSAVKMEIPMRFN